MTPTRSGSTSRRVTNRNIQSALINWRVEVIVRLRAGLMGVVAGVLVVACATGFNATFDHDPANNFGAYKTFAWIAEHPMKVGTTDRIPNPMLEPRIMSAIENGLTAKGYSLVQNAASANFVLAFTVGSREEIKVDSYPSMTAGHVGYGYPRHWGAWGGVHYGSTTETSVRQYTKGMLAIDVFDVAERRPVWHGVATKTINESDREDAAGTIKAAVDAILEGFPPS